MALLSGLPRLARKAADDFPHLHAHPRCVFLGIKAIDTTTNTSRPTSRWNFNLEPGADVATNAHAQLFFSLYFRHDRLARLHMIVGAGLLLWLIKESLRGRFTPDYKRPSKTLASTRHFVDIVWIFLFRCSI